MRMLMTSNENLETMCRQLVKIEIILLLPISGQVAIGYMDK
jgi:hypothetical protein